MPKITGSKEAPRHSDNRQNRKQEVVVATKVEEKIEEKHARTEAPLIKRVYEVIEQMESTDGELQVGTEEVCRLLSVAMTKMHESI